MELVWIIAIFVVGVLIAVPAGIWGMRMRWGSVSVGVGAGMGLASRKKIRARPIAQLQEADDVAVEGTVQAEQLIRSPVSSEEVVGFQLSYWEPVDPDVLNAGPPTVISRFEPFLVDDGSGVALVSAGNDVELRGTELGPKMSATEVNRDVLQGLGVTPEPGARVAVRRLQPGARVQVRGRARRQLAPDDGGGYRESPQRLRLESTEQWPLVIRVQKG